MYEWKTQIHSLHKRIYSELENIETVFQNYVSQQWRWEHTEQNIVENAQPVLILKAKLTLSSLTWSYSVLAGPLDNTFIGEGMFHLAFFFVVSSAA